MSDSYDKNICIVGLGYVGLTLAAAFLRQGARVTGVEVKASVRELLQNGQIHLHEPGVLETIRSHLGDRLQVRDTLPDLLDVVILCVGTPFDQSASQPRLDALLQVTEEVAVRMNDQTLVIVRSTVPVGTTKELVSPILQRQVQHPRIVFAPERTVQGRAVEELMLLPQIVGTDCAAHYQEAEQVFGLLGVTCVRVSSFAAAEMVKLICNAHTDVLYSFGNEVALLAERFGLDAYEVIEAANADYPRPNIHRPGYVGGSCLTKDPYHLLHGSNKRGYEPPLIRAARQVNESLPQKIFERLEEKLRVRGKKWADLRVLVAGFAYKGQPETDDLRGSAVWEVLDLLRSRGVREMYGHDFVANSAVLQELNVQPVEWPSGAVSCDVILLLNNHPRYQVADLPMLLTQEKREVLFFDLWGICREQMRGASDTSITYWGVGFDE